nr:MAG TPA: hypothetical protein [Bacteriophage sp.]
MPRILQIETISSAVNSLLPFTLALSVVSPMLIAMASSLRQSPAETIFPFSRFVLTTLCSPPFLLYSVFGMMLD